MPDQIFQARSATSSIILQRKLWPNSATLWSPTSGIWKSSRCSIGLDRPDSSHVAPEWWQRQVGRNLLRAISRLHMEKRQASRKTNLRQQNIVSVGDAGLNGHHLSRSILLSRENSSCEERIFNWLSIYPSIYPTRITMCVCMCVCWT